MFQDLKSELDEFLSHITANLPINKSLPSEWSQALPMKRKFLYFFSKTSRVADPSLAGRINDVLSKIESARCVINKNDPNEDDLKLYLNTHERLIEIHAYLFTSYKQHLLMCHNLPSEDFKNIAFGLNFLHLLIKEMAKPRSEINRIIGIYEKERNEAAFKEFITTMPRAFIEIRQKIAETYKGNCTSSGYLRALSFVIKCETCHTHIEELMKDINATSFVKSKVSNYQLPEGILWHPETFTGEPEFAKQSLIRLVVSYVKYFKLAEHQNLLFEFLQNHSDTLCFEGSMETLSDWVISKGLIGQDKNYLIENKSKLELLVKAINKNSKMSDAELLLVPNFTSLLSDFFMPQYAQLDPTLQDPEQILNALTNEVLKADPDTVMLYPRIRNLTNLYCQQLNLLDLNLITQELPLNTAGTLDV
ncbi:MAG: hypothetical protein WC627_11460 [Legionella sp.]|jgi:hypothetical protein